MELAFDVSNLEAVVGDIKAKGVEVCLPPIDINMGSGSKGMIAYIRDPDGTIIELVEVKTVAWISMPAFKHRHFGNVNDLAWPHFLCHHDEDKGDKEQC